MIKKLLILAIVLAMLNFGTVLAASPYDLNKLKADMAVIDANKAKITILMSSLSGLKIDSAAGMWNFIGRNGNELIIQKRSRIVREISAMKDENSSLSAGLLKSREAMYEGLAAGLKDAAFWQVLDYLDGLAAAEALSFNFLDEKEISSSDKSKDRVEFLRYRRDMQDIRLKNMETLISQLRAALKAKQQAKPDDVTADRDKYIRELGDKQAEGLKSQTAINNFIK
jgi:hypothetical protein